jgi:hypothetical protein
MSGLGNRVAARLRGEQKAPDAEITSKDGGTPGVSAEDAARNPNTIYAAALTLLGDEQASGQLDGDLASAAAKSLGQTYRKKHLSGNEGIAERSRKALQTESATYRIREELVGSGGHGAEDSLLSSLDAAISDLRRQLIAVRRQGESANRRNNGRPLQDQRLPSNWERPVVESTVKIQAIMSRMNQLAQAHEKAVSDFEALSP